MEANTNDTNEVSKSQGEIDFYNHSSSGNTVTVTVTVAVAELGFGSDNNDVHF